MALLGAALVFSQSASAAAPFREFPIGEPVVRSHMQIAAVYLPPIKMDHDMSAHQGIEHLLKTAKGHVIHLEADIHAETANPNGFGRGDWIPYLTVNYRLTHTKSKKEIKGTFMPMVAKDGAHYGATVTLPEKGHYKLRYEITPPSKNGFGRHTDPVTGVAPWWEPFTVNFEFDFKGFDAQS
ncbi:MAG: iron transporter [Deltaproteobacteria bacterium]|nr:iron transporter [Deltaproteobacteria bacterium]